MNRALMIMSAISGLLNGYGSAQQNKKELALKEKALENKDVTSAMHNFQFMQGLPTPEDRTNFMNMQAAASGFGFKPGAEGPVKYQVPKPASGGGGGKLNLGGEGGETY